LVRDRAGQRCEYCRLHQEHEPFYRFHVEHVVASVHGGTDEINNLALACHRCNEKKGTNLSARDPVSGKIVLLFNPRRQK
jgi:5-methylcytosine-specific restriction endonuclease McrA